MGQGFLFPPKTRTGDGESRETRRALSSGERVLTFDLFFGHQEGKNQVSQKTCASAEEEQYPDDAQDGWVNVQILGKTSAYAEEFLVAFATSKFFRFAHNLNTKY